VRAHDRRCAPRTAAPAARDRRYNTQSSIRAARSWVGNNNHLERLTLLSPLLPVAGASVDGFTMTLSGVGGTGWSFLEN
jgi:hypothetical protein